MTTTNVLSLLIKEGRFIIPSYKPRITVYTDEITNEKLAYIAKSENRSSSNYTEYLIKREIKAYETEHGEIKLKEKPTIEEAIKAQKHTIKGRKINPINKTLKESLQNGSDFGNAEALLFTPTESYWQKR